MHPVYKRENLMSEQAEIVRSWANIKIPCFLEIKKVLQAEETPFTVSYFKAANET